MQAMQQLLFAVLLKLYQSKPVQDKLAEWKAELFDWLKAQFAESKSEMITELKSWLPNFLKAIAVGMVQSAGQVIVNTEDKITDIIPGPIDDAVIDPMVERGLDTLGNLIDIKLR